MSTRVLILGAGFGGLELSTMLSEAFGGDLEVTLIDKSDAFVFGFSKLDVMFGRTTPDAVRLPYRDIAKPGVQFLQETITAIDPETRRVTTDAGVHEADVLVVALGADYDFDATPGLADGANEFYTEPGAARLAEIVPTFSEGRVIVGVCGAPFKCPPAPSECALLLDDALNARGVRDNCEISFVIPLGRPVPPSPETSAALETEFTERGITFIPGRRISSVDSGRSVAALDDGTELPFELFLGVPKHRAPDVVIASGMTEDGYVPVDSATLRTRYPGVYAVGDVATAGVPRRRAPVDRRAPRPRAPGPLRRPRFLLHRVRRRTRRAGGHRLPVRPHQDGQLQRTVRRPRGREGALRLQPPRALVRRLRSRPRPQPDARERVSRSRRRRS
jgi:sulfide:quinone oxidoreductase